jgi:nucleotide-binding universal stress UspA family protein
LFGPNGFALAVELQAMRHKILVGIDDTQNSWYTLETALKYASRFGATVVGILVESPFWSPPPMGAVAFESGVRRHAERLSAEHGVTLTFLVRHGYPAHTIAEQARLLGCDLVLLGHTDDTVLRRWWSGSLSDLVRVQAPCRVLVVRTGQVLELDQAPPPSHASTGLHLQNEVSSEPVKRFK